jgi:16S rRNA (cytosine967-C5)-methyltransferase
MQLASLGARVTSVDISARRLKRLEENLSRTKLTAKLVQADISLWQSEQLYDAIVLDAPCSATGTIRRHPDILWNTTPASITELAVLQKSLVLNASKFLKPGGILLYVNCSLMKDEGENLIQSISESGLEFDPIQKAELPGLETCINGQGAFRSLPYYLEMTDQQKSGMDGFFAARFKAMSVPNI